MLCRSLKAYVFFFFTVDTDFLSELLYHSELAIRPSSACRILQQWNMTPYGVEPV